MKCWCCGKEIKSENEAASGWHDKCIKKFFGTSSIPEISFDKNELDKLAYNYVSKGLTVPGIQKKLSLHLDVSKQGARFTLVDYPTGYILKPQSYDYPQLPEAEHLVMTMALATGISVVPFSMIKIGDDFAYITKRVDRLNTVKSAMEDFCQLSGRNTADKYKGSYEECGKIINRYSQRKGLDLAEFFLRLVFCDVTGNSDMHLKNFSLIETKPGNREFILSRAYDLLPVNVVMPADKDFTGLTLNGKKRNIRRSDFITLALNIGLSEKAADNMIKLVVGKQNLYRQLIEESYVSEDFKNKFKNLMAERMEMLS